MRITGCVSTDAGAGKTACTDAAVLKIAASGRYGRIAFAVLCDGADGVNDAGRASTVVAERLAAWFHEELPHILEKTEHDMRMKTQGRARARVLTEVLRAEDRRRSFMREMFDTAQIRIRKRLREIAGELNVRIAGYGRLHGRRAGCSATCLLLMGGEYMLMHIGPSRAHLADANELRRLVHRDFTDGADTRPFGTDEIVEPVFMRGAYERDTGFLLCSEAFMRKQDPDRLRKKISKCIRFSERRQEGVLRALTRSVRRRGEEDDAFAVFLACAR